MNDHGEHEQFDADLYFQRVEDENEQYEREVERRRWFLHDALKRLDEAKEQPL